MKHIAFALLPVFALSACSGMQLFKSPPKQDVAVTTAPTDSDLIVIDTEDVAVSEIPEDPSDPKPVAASDGLLGTTIASLGDATKDGFWIETPLVSSPGSGKVRYPANGREVRVQLIPITGATSAGSRLSLGAMRMLDAPLTGLPEIEVFQL